jgi:hypothetical protein
VQCQSQLCATNQSGTKSLTRCYLSKIKIGTLTTFGKCFVVSSLFLFPFFAPTPSHFVVFLAGHRRVDQCGFRRIPPFILLAVHDVGQSLLLRHGAPLATHRATQLLKRQLWVCQFQLRVPPVKQKKKCRGVAQPAQHPYKSHSRQRTHNNGHRLSALLPQAHRQPRYTYALT